MKVFTLLFGISIAIGSIGCSKVIPKTASTVIYTDPVTSEESRIIKMRWQTGLPVGPFEAVELGTPFSNKESLQSKPSHSATKYHAHQPEWLLKRMQFIREMSEKYLSQYPEDREALLQFRNSGMMNQQFENGEYQVSGASVLDALSFLVSSEGAWGGAHNWINILKKSSAVEDFIRFYIFGIYAQSEIATSAVDSEENENIDLAPNIKDASNCSLVLSRLEQKEDSSEWSPNECRLILALERKKYEQL